MLYLKIYHILTTPNLFTSHCPTIPIYHQSRTVVDVRPLALLAGQSQHHVCTIHFQRGSPSLSSGRAPATLAWVRTLSDPFHSLAPPQLNTNRFWWYFARWSERRSGAHVHILIYYHFENRLIFIAFLTDHPTTSPTTQSLPITDRIRPSSQFFFS